MAAFLSGPRGSPMSQPVPAALADAVWLKEMPAVQRVLAATKVWSKSEWTEVMGWATMWAGSCGDAAAVQCTRMRRRRACCSCVVHPHGFPTPLCALYSSLPSSNVHRIQIASCILVRESM